MSEDRGPTAAAQLLLSNEYYEQEILQLSPGQNEESFDRRQNLEAERLGVAVDGPEDTEDSRVPDPSPHGTFLPSWDSSTASLCAAQRSLSIGSAQTESTGITDPSRDSCETSYANLVTARRPSATRSLPLHRRVSQTSHPSSTRSSIVHNSFEQRRPPQTHSSRRPFSVRRGLERLSRLGKRPSRASLASGHDDRCCYCREVNAAERPVCHLRCGHNYCSDHLEVKIGESLGSTHPQPPQCCEGLLPWELVQMNTTPNQQTRLLNAFRDWHLRIHAAAAERPAVQHPTNGFSYASPGTEKKTATVTTVNEIHPETVVRGPADDVALRNLEAAFKLSSFSNLREQQFQQRRRIIQFLTEQRTVLKARRAETLIDLQHSYDQQAEQLGIKYTEEIADLEERHLVAELDLRQEHETQKRNIALALRHMEAYMRDPQRTASAQDRTELDTQRWRRDSVDARHDSAINVMRAQQTRQLRARQDAHDAELRALARASDKEIDRVSDLWRTEDLAIVHEFQARFDRAMKRWTLADRIWRASLTAQDTSLSVPWPVRHLDLPQLSLSAWSSTQSTLFDEEYHELPPPESPSTVRPVTARSSGDTVSATLSQDMEGQIHTHEQ